MENLFYLASFQAVIAVTGMILASIEKERRSALYELYKHRDELKRRVEKRTEELRDSEYRFRSLIQGARDYAIYILDRHGFITSWNEGAQRIKGYRAEEIIGQHFSKFFLAEDVRAGKPEQELSSAAENGRMEDESLRVRKDGSHFWANVVVTALRDKDGNLVGFSKITRDLTERKRAEDELRHAYDLLEKRVEERTEELREALQARDEFLSIASHELKTPLTSLHLQLQLLRRYVLQIFSPAARSAVDPVNVVAPEKLIHAAEICEKQSKKLAALLDELLDLTRIRAGRLELSREDVDLGAVVSDVIERQRETALKAGCQISLKDGSSVTGSWDRMRLEQIVTNLLSNSLKYGNRKPIEVAVEKDPTQGRAILKVKDQGIGIPSELRAKVFAPYERAITEQGKNNISGLGLGLYITRQIVEAHGGTIDFQSNLGEGTTFTVSLPLAKPIVGLQEHP